MVGSLKSCGSLDDQGRAGRGGTGRGRQERYGRRSWKGKAEHWKVEHRERERLEYRVITFFFLCVCVCVCVGFITFFFFGFIIIIFKCCADVENCRNYIGFSFI